MKRYSIITNDLEHCIECGNRNVELHEVFYGIRNRNKSITDGLVIPLCKQYHHQGNSVGIHKDIKLDMKYKKIAERKWLEYYDADLEDFIKRYGRNYL